MSAKSSESGGIGFIGLLQILFIALKLTNQIDWSWFWVLTPIWGSIMFVVFLFIILVILEVRK